MLRNPLSGYVNKNNRLNNFSTSISHDIEYFVISNYDPPKINFKLLEKYDLDLIRRFEFGIAWVELYKSK